jgi:hypothetical protein
MTKEILDHNSFKIIKLEVAHLSRKYLEDSRQSLSMIKEIILSTQPTQQSLGVGLQMCMPIGPFFMLVWVKVSHW